MLLSIFISLLFYSILLSAPAPAYFKDISSDVLAETPLFSSVGDFRCHSRTVSQVFH